ncbi:hypothetical protein ZIOFF_029108 [Zingiber officinale]|uniref:Plant disease resistance WDH domain-containing protein n=2 Tax=Zingiber officinale TaxID=94328 RepID=A0A8J5GX33_ZINOF|nr:hypothetical protein ZIOFF_029108 [Zingiber officinale]
MDQSTSQGLPTMSDVFADSSGSSTSTLTVRIAGPCSSESGEKSVPISPSISLSPHLNSPSPPSSAFVSALQSPYISPRALEPPNANNNYSTASATATIPSSTSYSASHSGDIPSTSYTPPSERSDFVADQIDQKPKFSDAMLPRISFSFPVPRTSLTKGSVSPPSDLKLHGCDVYIGYYGHSHMLVRFCKWLKTELELQGVASFVADRAKYSDSQSHEIADRIICSAAFGVIVVTPLSFLNPLSVEEISFFAQKMNLISVLFDTELSEIVSLLNERLEDKESREALEGFTKCNEFKIETNGSNWRSCISKVVGVLKSRLGRRSIAEVETECFEELPFPRNVHFVGRAKEVTEIEAAFFGCTEGNEMECPKPSLTRGSSSDGFADEEIDTVRTSKKYISLEMRKCKEPTLEAWIEPVIELPSKGRSLQKQRSKHKKSRCSSANKGHGNASSVFCINGSSGIGKTELALEFAYRYAQRYRMVLWIGGETRYLRQNILNLSMKLGLDLSAEGEKERGRIRSFDEQEFDAFLRVKRELFRDIPYLLVVDNLETEKEWWEGKDLHDLIPRNTGATHVIITTRLPKVTSFEPMQLPPFSLTDSLLLLKGRRKKDYTSEEVEVLKKLDERLERLSFGLSVVGSLLSELPISPLELLEEIDRISVNDGNFLSWGNEDCFWRCKIFLMKTLVFCFAVVDQATGRSLASRMALSGAWFASAPVSSNLLAAASNNLPTKGSFCQWGKGLTDVFLCASKCCLAASQARKSEVDSAMLLVNLGLAKRSTKQPGCWIQLHPITQVFAKRKGGLPPAKAAVHGAMRAGNAAMNLDHLWASAFLVFGFKQEPPVVQLSALDMVFFIKTTALPLAIRSFMTFSRCNSALELLKVCTNALEEAEKSFVSQIQDWRQGRLCWKKKLQSNQKKVDEYVWQDVTLLKATMLETRAKLLLRGGHFDEGEELCRTCVSIRTVMLGHNHGQTLAAQETLAKLVRKEERVKHRTGSPLSLRHAKMSPCKARHGFHPSSNRVCPHKNGVSFQPFLLYISPFRPSLPSGLQVCNSQGEEESLQDSSFSSLPPAEAIPMEMRKIACAALVLATAATTALAAEAPAPGPASASFAVTPPVGAAIAASFLSFFAFYLQ